MSPVAVDQYDNVRGQSQIQITPNNVPPVPKLTIFLSALFPAGSTRASSSPLSFVNRFCLIWTEGQRGKENGRARGGMDGRGTEE